MSSTTSSPPSSTPRTSITSWRLPFGDSLTINPEDDGGQPRFSASIITIAPSTTAFVLTCHPNCHNWAPTITIGGDWAEITSPPNATITSTPGSGGNGTFDFHLLSSPNGPYTYTDTFPHSTATVVETHNPPIQETTAMSYHCDIHGTSSVGLCTESLDQQGPTPVTGTFTFTGVGPDWTMTGIPVTITAGIGMEAVTAKPTHNAAAYMAPGGLGSWALSALVASFFV